MSSGNFSGQIVISKGADDISQDYLVSDDFFDIWFIARLFDLNSLVDIPQRIVEFAFVEESLGSGKDGEGGVQTFSQSSEDIESALGVTVCFRDSGECDE